jgi:flavin-dependent dehydrogenase
VVIGAGPAGSAAASVLGSSGYRVLLLEKDRLPRRKVCGEFLSGRAREGLGRLGVLAAVEAIAVPIRGGALHLASGRAIPFPLPAPALGISRFALDALLARRAAELGAEVRCGARVLGVARDGGGFRVRWAGAGGAEPGEVSAAVIIGAWGRWDALDRALERRFGRERARYLGWSADYATDGTDAFAHDVRLYVFPGGYCGLSPVEGGRTHLAGVISERARRRLAPGWPAVVAHARLANRTLDRDLSAVQGQEGDLLGTGPVYFTRKPPVSDGVILTGDAAGVLDPFSGEGQASALASGLLAGDAAARALGSVSGADALAADYAREWRRRFGWRFAWSAAFRRLVLSPRLADAAARLAGRTLMGLAVRKIAGP